jgi:hypothetical protein
VAHTRLSLTTEGREGGAKVEAFHILPGPFLSIRDVSCGFVEESAQLRRKEAPGLYLIASLGRAFRLPVPHRDTTTVCCARSEVTQNFTFGVLSLL